MKTAKTKKAGGKLRAVLLFGAPGSGKGTQGKILGTIPNYYHFSCGDVFRNLTPDAPLGRTFLNYSSRGQLVPDEPTIQLWRHNIEVAEHGGRFNPATDTLVLDGIPRNTRQAQMLEGHGKGAFCLLSELPGHGQIGGAAATARAAGKPPR